MLDLAMHGYLIPTTQRVCFLISAASVTAHAAIPSPLTPSAGRQAGSCSLGRPLSALRAAPLLALFVFASPHFPPSRSQRVLARSVHEGGSGELGRGSGGDGREA